MNSFSGGRSACFAAPAHVKTGAPYALPTSESEVEVNKVQRLMATAVMSAMLVVGSGLPAHADSHGSVCREVFSDNVCTFLENPFPIIWPYTDPVVACVNDLLTGGNCQVA